MKNGLLLVALAISMEAKTCLGVDAQTNLGDDLSPLEVVVQRIAGNAVEPAQRFQVPRDAVCLETGQYLVRVFAAGFLSANRIIDVTAKQPISARFFLAIGLNFGSSKRRCEFVLASGGGRGLTNADRVRLLSLDVDFPVQDVARDAEGKIAAELDDRATYLAIAFVKARMAGSAIDSPGQGCRMPIEIRERIFG